MTIKFQNSWNIHKAATAALLYEEAFGNKFTGAIPNKQKRIEIIKDSFIPEFSFAAIADEEIVGLAGFQTAAGSLTGGIDAKLLLKSLGIGHGLWACLVFSLFDRKAKPSELVMDGIAVNSNFRGQGIGSKLLNQIIRYAVDNKYESVRLDVIDSNPRARKLYESMGFIESKTEYFPYLKWLIGFSGATTMVLNISESQ